MTTHTVGTFIREKMNNMAKWVHDEVGKENLGVDLVDFVAKKTDSELVYLAGLLKTKEDGIEKESFASISGDPNVPDQIKIVVKRVEAVDHMHSKFWRYIRLFVHVISE